MVTVAMRRPSPAPGKLKGIGIGMKNPSAGSENSGLAIPFRLSWIR